MAKKLSFQPYSLISNHFYLNPHHNQSQQTQKHVQLTANKSFNISENIIDDLCSRFIINIPNEEQDNLIRICFQIEMAHWFYLDFHCEEIPSLPKCQYRDFARIIFNHVPFLNAHLYRLEKIIENWKEYKLSVPTYGAILLDESMEYVLMVQGYWAKGGWGFPKGKINENESPMNCACREVREETGFNCETKITEDDFIEVRIRETLVRLYIIKGVDRKQIFKPITRNEIKNIEWFKIIDLPQSKRDMAFKQNLKLNANCFFMVMPFVRPLRKWISREKTKNDIKNLKIHSFVSNTDKSFGKPGNKFENKFWAKSWNNIRFDWEKIWKDIS